MEMENPATGYQSAIGADSGEGPDTQEVGELLWAELHQNGTQQPNNFEWVPYLTTPAPAALLQDSAASPPSSDCPPSSRSTPEITPGFSIPPGLASWRQRLFEFDENEPLTLSLQQWEQYWPFFSNIWTRHRPPYNPKRKQTVRTYWDCRFHKEQAYKSLNTGSRKKVVRDEIGCGAKLIEVHDLLSSCRTFTMTGSHNHSIKELDMTKLNDGIQSWVDTQLLQGFSATAIEKVARGKGKDPFACKNLEDAGGHDLSVKSIHNASQRLNIRVPISRNAIGKVSIESQAREAFEWLQNHKEEWYSAYLDTSYRGESSPGLVFARKRTIGILRMRGVLTLMDSTHNTNKGEW